MMLKKILSFIQSNSEFSIVLGVLMVLAMIIIPLPHELLDVLIGTNITLSIVMLMVVLYINSPLNLTAFPTILLLLALFRIGITISTTRLILLEANAGKIVQTFGEFVLGGNLVVGIIVFIIITIINFIVITKGSERVAEVTARFSLDGMPGKQMSIDSDLRAGLITAPEAIERRKTLELESKLYGAMDGAMKFVKGDSIASIIDIIVNLVGGIIVGIFFANLTMGQALHTYSILTVGDGLVQQIPALIVSITSGMMITRVTDNTDKEKQNLGQVIIKQVMNFPKAFLATALILVLIGFVPGMPTTVFMVLSGLLVSGGLAVMSFAKKREAAAPTTGVAEPKIIEQKGNDLEDLPLLDKWKLYPLLLHISNSFKETDNVAKIKDALTLVQKNIMVDLGVEIPQIYIRYDGNQPSDCYQVLVQEVPAARGRVYRDCILILDSEENVSLYGIHDHVPNVMNIGEKVLGFWVHQTYLEICKEYSLPYLTLEEFLGKHLSFFIRQHISEFLGMQEVKNMIDKMTEYQDLTKELLRMLPLNKITEIMQRLIEEDVSIRNFKAILDALLEWAQREKDTIMLTEYVRGALGRYIAFKFSNGKYVMPSILISSDLEDSVRDAIRNTANGSYLALDPNISNKVVAKLKEIVAKHKSISVKPILLVTLDVRRYMRSIVERELPYLHVLSFQELEGHVQFENIGVLEI